ncbi:type IV toxin-antitoxin system AbiEi family antitoxin domain-containing protein [Propionicimonas paludicola]|uniref:type IV toxin-antitoxin system AbiEi family antitoxin domain-containing protein n=1 Tax=Propionicimonas paludicola TaxID=185243 RepID=UPI001472DB13
MRTPLPLLLPAVPTAERDLVALGVSRRRLAAAASSGRLLRVRRGVYLDPARWPDDELGRHLVRAHAEQANLPAAVVSHRSAAAFWGLPIPQASWADEPVWVTLPPGAGSGPAVGRGWSGRLRSCRLTRWRSPPSASGSRRSPEPLPISVSALTCRRV